MKRFYNNKLMRLAPKGALRFIALLYVLLGVSGSAWATYYIDARDYISMGKTFRINWIQDANSNNISYSEVETGLWSFETKFAKAEFNANGKSTKYGPGQEANLPTLSGSNDCYLINANGIPTVAVFSGTSGGGSTGGDTGDDGGDDTGGSTGGSTNCNGKSTVYADFTNINWPDASAKLYAYWWNTTTNGWIKLTQTTKCDNNKLYYVTLENSIVGFKFVRLSSDATTPTFDKKWNETGDLELSGNEGKSFKFNDWGAGSWENTSCTESDCSGSDTPDDPDDPIEYTTKVILTRDAEVDEDAMTATLYGYMQGHPNENECTNIQFYGFAFCEGQNCIPTTTNTDCGDYVHADASHNNENLVRGKEFSATLSSSCGNLQEGKVYGYRAYVWDGKAVLSDETRYFATKGGCIPIPGGGDTIRVTVDAATYFNNDTTKYDNCNLRFGNLYRALNYLKSNREYVDENGSLNQPIIITVANVPEKYNWEEDCDGDDEGVKEKKQIAAYAGEERAVSGGDGGASATFNVMPIEGFNKNKTTGYFPLIIKAKNGHSPRIQHLLIRSSRGVTLDGLGFFSKALDCGDAKDTALEIDNGECNKNWHNLTQDFNDADILVKNCVIGSNGFTGAHIIAYDGVTFENNIFNLSTTDITDNAASWGASVKFFECKNIKFVRNNLMGEHGTLIWLQQTSNVLIYNNVFWNTNQYNAKCMAIRVCKQYPEDDTHTKNYQMPDNIACLYNTFYLADNSKNAQAYDFLGAYEGKEITGNITFMYNNCYSYDTDVPGAAKVGLGKFTGTKNFCPNNFWSVYDVANKKNPSVFQFEECEGQTEFINVANLVCETSASGPSSLIIKEASNGDGLKVGTPLTAANIKSYVGSDIEITDDGLKHDRNHDNVRKGNKWTLGAFEASAANEVDVIYWVGGTDTNWDNRNNWKWRDKNGKDQQLTCVDNLTSNLKVVIGEKGSTQYPTTSSAHHYYPVIPSTFDATERRNEIIGYKNDQPVYSNIPPAEQVAAGRGYTEPTKYATSIELEYGAGISGIEHLVDADTKLYDEAITHLNVPRREWILVGSMIKPWVDENKEDTRYIVSRDYYLHHFPHVYMHQAILQGTGASWENPFADLTVNVRENEAYAIRVADEYGEYKLPADYYYTNIENNPDMVNDGTKQKSFDFQGRFLHDSAPLSFGELTAETPYLLCNTYPANIDIVAFTAKYPGTVQTYDYVQGSFVQKDAGDILSQHGFVFTPAETKDVTLDDKYLFSSGVTRPQQFARTRAAKRVLPKFRLEASNTAAPRSSNVLIKVDELKPDIEDYATDAPKIFNNDDNKVPEVYVMRYDKKWAGMVVPNMEEPIPLGVRTSKKNVSIRFSISDMRGISSATLEDRMLGVTYNLGTEECIIESLPKGETEGRFFLNLKAAEVTPDEEDDNVATDVEEELVSESGISIIGNSEGIIVSSSSDIELQTIIVNDMSGKSASYKVSGQYAEINLPVAQGVYTVSVIGDTASKIGKVILK